jgi:type IV/VI secretion system ImpK/VasF family protein
MTTVPELFTPFFAYILLLEQEYASGHSQRTYEQVRGDLAALLAEQDTGARQQGMSPQDYQAARLVVISWADGMLQQMARGDRQRWQALPLQAEYYGTPQAGAEPGEERQRLLSERPGVREVYALCLSLGFRGQRQNGRSDSLPLTDSQCQLTSQPPQAPDAPLLVDDVWTPNFKLTPQPYAVQRHGPWYVRHLLAFAVPLLALLGLGLWMVWPKPPPPCLPPSMSGPVITQMLAQQPCARVSAAVEGCRVTLSGRVASADQRTEIHHVVQSIASTVRVDDELLQIIPQPFCGVLALLEPVQTYADTHAFGVVAHPNKVSVPPVYRQGENLLIEVTTPAQFASYIYVDFYNNDGRVYNLVANPDLRPFPPQSVHTLPDYAHGQPVWGVGPPYGRGLMTVIASKTPLVFPRLGPQADPGSAAVYLSQLRQALPQDVTQANVAATFFFLETRAQ